MPCCSDSRQPRYPPWSAGNYRRSYRILIIGLRHRLHMPGNQVPPPITHGFRHRLRVDKSGYPPAAASRRRRSSCAIRRSINSGAVVWCVRLHPRRLALPEGLTQNNCFKVAAGSVRWCSFTRRGMGRARFAAAPRIQRRCAANSAWRADLWKATRIGHRRMPGYSAPGALRGSDQLNLLVTYVDLPGALTGSAWLSQPRLSCSDRRSERKAPTGALWLS